MYGAGNSVNLNGGTSGDNSNTQALTISVAAPPTSDFSLSASPTSLTITQGSSGSSTITVTPLNGFTGSVALKAAGLRNGVTARVSPTSKKGKRNLTLAASSTATTGTSTVTITGPSGTLSHTTTVSLTVNAAPNFSLSVLPSSLTVIQGASGTSTVSVAALNGFTGSVALAASGMPTGVTAPFTPTSPPLPNTLTLAPNST